MAISKTLFLLCVALLLINQCTSQLWWGRRRRRRSPPPCQPKTCSVSQWTGWSKCSHKCGNSGQSTRTRRILIAATCGGSCPYHFVETRSCNRHCPNGGTPQSGYCSCRPGFAGTCCQQGEYLYMYSSYATAQMEEYHSQVILFLQVARRTKNLNRSLCGCFKLGRASIDLN